MLVAALVYLAAGLTLTARRGEDDDAPRR